MGVRNTAFQYSSANVETATARIRSVRVRPLPRTTHPSSWWLSRRKSAHRTGGGACTDIANDALRLMRNISAEGRAKNQPWMLAVGFRKPHLQVRKKAVNAG